jgi:hypothetical protein
MSGFSLVNASRLAPGVSTPNRWPHRKTLAHNNNSRPLRLVAGRLSHYSTLYEVQHDQGMALDAVQHLHHMVHGRYSSSCCKSIAAVLLQKQHQLPSTPITLVYANGVPAGPNNTLGPLYLATFCALSVTLGALLFNLTTVLNEYFALQQQLTKKHEVRISHQLLQLHTAAGVLSAGALSVAVFRRMQTDSCLC